MTTLPLAYNWRRSLALAAIPLAIAVAFELYARAPEWYVPVLLGAMIWLCWAGYAWLKCRAFLELHDDGTLVTRRFFGKRTVRGADVTKVREIVNGRSPDILLVTPQQRAAVVSSRLEGGHSLLFAWLRAHAPQADYDRGSQRVALLLEDRGLLEPAGYEPRPTATDREER